jgi:membrane-associated phospholipid phosphatase
MGRTTPRIMLAAAFWCVVAFFGLLVVAYFTGPGRWLDSAASHGFEATHHDRIDRVAHTIAHLCNPLPYALASLVVIAIAAKARGPRIAAAIAMLIIGANATSQLLKPALAFHRELWDTHWHLYNLPNAAYPSGHATAAMTLAMAVMIVVPRAFRPLVAALGALFTVSVSFAVLILHWHFPSDIVGGYLIATAWGFVTFAALRALNERWPESGTVRQVARAALPAPSTATIAKAGLAAAVIAALVAASRAHQIASFADRHTAATAVASAIAVAAAVLLAAVASISSRSRSR